MNEMEVHTMKCLECGKEMRDGYLFCSKDGAFSFANKVPGVFENAKNAEGFVKITELKPSHRTIAVFENANKGKIIKFAYGLKECSILDKIHSSFSSLAIGISIAKSTPLIVA